MVVLTEKNWSSGLDSSQAEVKCGVDSHSLAPNINLPGFIEGKTVVKAACYINDPISFLEINFHRVESKTDSSVLQTELAKDVPAPSVDLSMSGENPGK